MHLSRREYRVVRLLLNLAEEHDLDMFIDDIRTFKQVRDRFNGTSNRIRKEKRRKEKFKNSRIKALRQRINNGGFSQEQNHTGRQRRKD